jgi:poly(3-hydroxybutyrate) depolymerase
VELDTMTTNLLMRRSAALTVLLSALVVPAGRAQSPAPAGLTLEHTVAPGTNFDKADFRLWLPDGVSAVQAIVVLVPGSNGDGRGMVDDEVWRGFATRHKLALVGCRFTDKPHDQSFIEHYVNVSQGTGQALLDALGAFGDEARHPELAGAPLYLWGMSAGGEFDYEFVAWKPERVVAFVVNKGGIYYTALASREARSVPGLLFVGEKDLEFRTNTIVGLFAVNRRAGALWALTQEPGIAHAVGRSRDLGVIFFEDVLALRLGASSNGGRLGAVDEKSGFVGDLKAQTFKTAADAGTLSVPTAWLPTERVARAWQAVVAGKPFDQ